jgi:molecular chaperone HtpG
MSETKLNAPETHAFQAEVTQLLDLVINSLYSHKEVFLRELVSNASDALDKLRFRALTEPDLTKDGAPLEIRISADKAAQTVTIEDSGVGMTKDELVKNLGTIAHSGTRGFLETMKQAGKADANLIGQFGVGFYSAYLAADRVDVVSRAAGSDDAFRWSSDAKGSFKVEPTEMAGRGTQITLHIKEEQKQFLEEWQLRDLVKRYSDFVSYPINLRVTKRVGTGDEAKNELVFEAVNRASALWQRPKAEITEEQHDEFYKHLTHDGDGPLARCHFTVEGNQVFTALLYIPKHAPMVELDADRRGVRLFVKRVFIMDDCRELLPQWMRFVRGVVDSDDLPLNVSRETLQDSQIVRTIKKQVVKKVLDSLDEMAKSKAEEFATFWKAFGVTLKEGLATEWEHRERLSKLLRYPSSKGDGMVSLETYVARMPTGQEAIYYVFGESEKALAASPHIEALKKRGYEVLFMTDPIDEWATDSLREFDKKPLVSAMRADLKLSESGDEKKGREENEGKLTALTKKIREVLGEHIADVRVTDRLTESPVCLVVQEGEHHAFLEQVLKSHGRAVTASKRTLEVNPAHPLVLALRELCEREPESPRLVEWIELLHDQALLTEGSRIADPNRFAKRMTDLLSQAAKAAVA